MRLFLVLFLSFASLFGATLSKETDVFHTEKIKDFETKKCMDEWLNGNFGLKPHKPNYILPYGIRAGGKEYRSYLASDRYKSYEAELQVSLKLNIANNVFGLHESYNLAYSHKAFWQIYASSSPFRETNYNPEMFVVFPIEDDSLVKMTSLTFAFAHLSNGQGNIEDVNLPAQVFQDKELAPYLQNRSRSINYIYTKLDMQYDNFLVDLKAWVPYFGDDLSDNPDIMDYIGYTSVKLRYFYAKHMLTLDARGNFFSGKGALELTYSHPLYTDLYLYAKVFTGYNESLIDYNNYVTKFAIGFSFSR